MTTNHSVEERLSALEGRFDRVENLLEKISAQLGQDSQTPALDEAKLEGIKQWVTDFVSMRLQQLVPETCVHEPEERTGEGPFLGDTSVRCTEDVVHRLKRIPIPFVRDMVIQRVAENAREHQVELVDVEFFEKAATF